jgi:hypothetical protein
MVPTTITPNSNHSGVTLLKGFNITEDASAAAHVRFRKAAVGGQIIATVKLAADGTAMIIFDEAISSEGGVYVQEVAGSVEGVLFDASA